MENINLLVNDLEHPKLDIKKNDTNFNKPCINSVVEPYSLSILKENLVKFQFRLNNHNLNDNLLLNPSKFGNNTKNEQLNKDSILKLQLNDNASISTTRDTLIDADLSFDSLHFLKNFNEYETKSSDNSSSYYPIIEEKNKIKEVNQQMEKEKNLKITETDQQENEKNINIDKEIMENKDFDDDDEYDKILSICDLSLTSLQSVSDDCTDNTKETNKSQDQFEENLKKLDEKIFKVKELLKNLNN